MATITTEQEIAIPDGPNSVSVVGTRMLYGSSDGRWFVASEAVVMGTGQEILVFPADEHGEIIDYGEVAGGRNVSHTWAKDDLADYLETR